MYSTLECTDYSQSSWQIALISLSFIVVFNITETCNSIYDFYFPFYSSSRYQYSQSIFHLNTRVKINLLI